MYSLVLFHASCVSKSAASIISFGIGTKILANSENTVTSLSTRIAAPPDRGLYIPVPDEELMTGVSTENRLNNPPTEQLGIIAVTRFAVGSVFRNAFQPAVCT